VPPKPFLANTTEGKAFSQAAGGSKRPWRGWRRGNQNEAEVRPLGYGMPWFGNYFDFIHGIVSYLGLY
jgi:hypothetical protein